MKRFDFRLQKILDLRQAREKASLAELGRELGRLTQENRKLDLFQGEQRAQLDEIGASRAGEFTAWMQTTNARYLQRVGRAIEFQAHSVRRQEGCVEAARGRFHERKRETKVLDQLRERKRDEWQAEALREETKILDEVAARRKDP